MAHHRAFHKLPMAEKLRFTGENPPPSLWSRFPNWQNAYDEEGIPGQDETTLRPADNQRTIDGEVTFTAGDATFACGDTVPAMLGVISGELGWIYVYPNPDEELCWVLSFHVPSNHWIAMNDDWFLEGGEVLRVPVGDSDVFPMRVGSRLPLQSSGEVIKVEIGNPKMN